jgi:hypothetical protein
MVDRGNNCTFVTKTRNVQNAGGAIALIINNVEKDVNKILMIDDGSGSDLTIPAVLINKRDGEKIKEEMKKGNSAVYIRIEFDMKKTDIVTYQIFFSSTTKRIYKLLRDFYPYHKVMKEKLNFIPHYISHHAPFGFEAKNISRDCISDGKFCVKPKPELGISQGKEILYEDMRQKCIYTVTKDNKYWDYMNQFYENCLNKTEFTFSCSKAMLEEVDIDLGKEKDCLLEAYTLDEKKEKLVYNPNTTLQLIEDDYVMKKQWGLKVFPAILVNNKSIEGDWTAENLLEAVCSGFRDPPKVCKPGYILNEDNNSDFGVFSIISILLIIIVLNAIVIIACRRYMLKRLEDRVQNIDLDNRITNVANSYMALRDTQR